MARGFFGYNCDFLFEILPPYLRSNSISAPTLPRQMGYEHDLLALWLDTAKKCNEIFDYVAALSVLRAAIKTRTHDPNTQRRLTIELLDMCEWDSAIGSCDAEIVLAPNDPYPRLLAAYLLAHSHQFDRAKIYVECGLRMATQFDQVEVRTDLFALGKRLGMDEQFLLEILRYITKPKDTNEFAAQLNNATDSDRHPDIFTTARELVANEKIDEINILSFGCSTGKEPYVLATKYFRGARIVAVDISAAVLEIAKTEHSIPGTITYDLSSPENIKKHGPYDVIFAMSVLCRWPDLAGQSDASDLFPFSKYLELVTVLRDNLRKGGLLVIYNASYDFSHVDFIDEFEIVKTPANISNGYVKRFGRDGIAIKCYTGTELVYRKL